MAAVERETVYTVPWWKEPDRAGVHTGAAADATGAPAASATAPPTPAQLGLIIDPTFDQRTRSSAADGS
jgi:hypothetical protein